MRSSAYLLFSVFVSISFMISTNSKISANESYFRNLVLYFFNYWKVAEIQIR
jgi:hypothetical protein